MGNIVLLDDLTINKIAAGEVIERPASVVKEVVENSIDAGANNISVEIKNGGISYIRITDDGKGIAADDLEIAFERHATSKIRKAEDLETVKSMGFRGEALASISAIARVELITKTEESDVGYRIIVEGGKILLKEETGCPKGTSITIENLFYNTPVRYKFLKKDFTESGYIEDVITRIALVNPDVAIKLVNTGKTVIQTSGNGNIKDIVYGIYGKDIAENIIDVDYSFEDMSVKGVIGKPSIARSNRSNQLFFVNKRYVKDKTLTSAAEQAFKGKLPVGKYGFLILNIEIDSHKLDVNVHPAKLEVRFQEESMVFKLVYHAVEEALQKCDMSASQEKDDYIDEIEKIENKLFEGTVPAKEHSIGKGIGGFIKSILGSSKNEFVDNKENVVEQLYRDKFQQDSEDNVDVSGNSGSEIGVDYSLGSLSKETISKSNGSNSLTEKNESVGNSSIVTSDYKDDSELRNENTSNLDDTIYDADDLKKVSDSDGVDSNNNVAGVGTTSNLEKLVKELDANLKKLNMKPVDFGTNVIDGNDGKEEKISIDTNNTDIVSSYSNESDTVHSSQSDNDYINNSSSDVQISSVSNNNGLNLYNKSEEVNSSNSSSNSSNNSRSSGVVEKEPELNFEEMYEKMFGTHISGRNKVEEPMKASAYSAKPDEFKTVENVSLFTNNAFYSKPVYKYIGMAFGENIVLEYENELYIVDQRAVNERIMYEKVRSNYYNDLSKDSQLMLLPDIINLTDKQMGIAEDNFQIFKKAGFDIEIFGDKTIKLNAVPSMCMDFDTKQLFMSILDEINTVARTAKEEIEDKFFATVACKVATKLGLAKNEKEVDNLMQELLLLPRPFVSPNGTPTAIRMSKADIEKKFSRR